MKIIFITVFVMLSTVFETQAQVKISRIAWGTGLPAGSSINVLWIGNSLTGAPSSIEGQVDYEPMPGRLVPMLGELGITMTYNSVIVGGSEFSIHDTNQTTMAEIANPIYDAVNFQRSYQGINDSSDYIAAVSHLYTAAHNIGSVALFESNWEFGGFGSHPLDYGGPLYPQEENAIEGAAAALPGSFPVQVSRCWQAVTDSNPALLPKMHDDGVHQSALGEYFNALIYARFFSGRSVKNIMSVLQYVVDHSTSAERQYLRDIVDANVTIFYGASSAPTASLTIQFPTPGQIIDASHNVVYQATARDTVSGNLNAAIQWYNDIGTEQHVGPSFTQSLPSGRYNITARVTGSDGKQVSVTRGFVVASGANQAPTATPNSQIINYNTPFMQMNLSANVSDPDGTINWDSLQLNISAFHGDSAWQDSRDLSTVNVNYENTNFSGDDHFSWRVQDNDGAWSNWTTATLKVQQPTSSSSVSNVPLNFSLCQNFPNPFNPSTTISFSVGTYGHTCLKIFDILGREIKTLVNEVKSPGTYNIPWDGKNSNRQKVGSGVYFYQLSVVPLGRRDLIPTESRNRKTESGFTKTQKMILLN